MSPRRRNKFLFAGFGRISVTRLLSVRSKAEKKTGIFCTKQLLCAMFYGGFLLFEAVRLRNLAAGTKKSEPRKRNSRPRKKNSKPRIFSPGPVFLRRRLGSTFSRYLELFHRQIPDVNMSAQAPPGLRAPAIPARKQPAPATKRKPAPSICRHLGFRTFRETAFFAPATAPCPVQVNLRGLQMTKCQIPGQITKCQIRRGVSAGKHETVPRYISTAPFLSGAKKRLFLSCGQKKPFLGLSGVFCSSLRERSRFTSCVVGHAGLKICVACAGGSGLRPLWQHALSWPGQPCTFFCNKSFQVPQTPLSGR